MHDFGIIALVIKILVFIYFKVLFGERNHETY